MSFSSRGQGVVCAIAASVCCESALGVEQTVTWEGNGPGDTTLWSNAQNWNPQVVPCNLGPVEFNVVIPAGFSLVNHDAAAGDCTIRSLTLGDNTTLRITAGSSLMVTTTANLCGILDARDNFTATQSKGTTAAFSCNRARMTAVTAGIVTIDATYYDSTGLWGTDGMGSVITFSWPLMTASGTGTMLDLSGVMEINAGFSSGGNDNDHQKITASGGALIDLSGLQMMTAPVAGNDRVEFIATGAGSLIDMSSLTELRDAGSGTYLLDLDAGGTIKTGGLTCHTPTPVTLDGAGSTFHVQGNLRADAALTINLNTVDTQLDLDGSLFAGNLVDIIAADGAKLNVGGNFCYNHTNESELQLGGAIVQFDGSGPQPQMLEVGGFDLDTACILFSNDNFAFGQMIVGQPGQATTLELRNGIDNGNQPGAKQEAMYLFGLEGLPTLRILGGSTLVLNGINLYLCDTATHINDLFSGGETMIAFDEGFIALGEPQLTGDINGNGVVDGIDLGILLGNWSIPAGAPGCEDALNCPADINCDGFVNGIDLGILLGNWTL